jgi:hypothetical protein
MKTIDFNLLKGAIFSGDRKYRYALWRIWNIVHKPLLFIGLNPSNANELSDDPTITRCIVRAANTGFGGLLVANLYAFVSPYPEVLLSNGKAIGTENNAYLKQMIGLAEQSLCGWGSFPAAAKRATSVLRMIQEPYCLGINKDGQPKHPLYIGYNVPMVKLKQEFPKEV